MLGPGPRLIKRKKKKIPGRGLTEVEEHCFTVLDKRCRENQNTFYVQKPFPEYRATCEIMRKNKLDRERPQITIQGEHKFFP